MDISWKTICDYFKCYDTQVEKIHINETGKKLLQFFGFYPEIANWKTLLKLLFRINSFLLLMYGQIGHFIHYYLEYHEFTFFHVVDDITVTLSTFLCFMVVVYLSMCAPRFEQISKEIGDFSNPILGRAPGVEALAKFYAKFIIAWFMGFVIMGTLTLIYYLTDVCAPDEISTCGFIYLPYLPYLDIYNKPWRQIVLFLQCASAYLGGACTCVIMCQYVLLNEVLILRFHHLGNIIKTIPASALEERSKLLKRVVDYHNYLLKVHQESNSYFGRSNTVHVFITPVTLSLIIYQLVKKGFASSAATHLSGYFINLTLTCCSCERLTTFTGKLTDDILSSIPWENPSLAKDMNLMLMMAQQTVAVEAGGVTSLNHVFMSNTERFIDDIVASIPLENIPIAKDMQLLLHMAQKPVLIKVGSVRGLNHLLIVNIYQSVWSMLTFISQTSDQSAQ